ncbi:HD domain-containing phosphohydrolase [Roseospira goensis]|uniref:HD-GYP domain-containing protein (C-di-GMP phosphodiesterase class II) n=1 Tax=Roseospira goensis TaxID=391922 RepID=A0A7W6WJ90_9PROT|nr:HD-GYP domain-containing protein (c-di-GMP phosphodiesterase class II) [Roseospira goensis]
MDLRELIYVLSGVLDFVGVTDVHHGKRVAHMAVATGRALGVTGERQATLFEAALLHDIGVSTTREHDRLIAEPGYPDMRRHCRRGEAILSRFGPLAHLAPIVAQHHTPWFQLRTINDTVTDDMRQAASVIHLVDRVDAQLAGHGAADPLALRRHVLDRLAQTDARLFAPDVVAAFRTAAASDALWFGLDPDALPVALAPLARGGQYHTLSAAELIDVATLFAGIVDAKSPFTAEHSAGVARLSVCLGQWVGLDPEQITLLEVAALLHDIGKLRVPDHILDKPGPLTRAERAVMNRHAYYTHHILAQITGFESVALWAACHHEALDGSGYPFRKDATTLPLEARIIAVADVFQALAQTRPYRPALGLPQIMEILEQMAARRILDGDLVALVAANRVECWHRAVEAAAVAA